MRVLVRFMLSALDVSHFPSTNLPEIAFLGRSNVGKSSLLNSLLGTKIARTSSTPGRTQSINFFEVRRAGKPEPEFVFADLPGYGYARAPKAVTQTWSSFIDPYLHQRASLVLCLALVDPNVPPQGSDKQLLDFLSSSRRPFIVVATKSDRSSGNKLRSSLANLAREYPEAQILPFSARTGAGKNELWREIQAAVERYQSVIP